MQANQMIISNILTMFIDIWSYTKMQFGFKRSSSSSLCRCEVQGYGFEEHIRRKQTTKKRLAYIYCSLPQAPLSAAVAGSWIFSLWWIWERKYFIMQTSEEKKLSYFTTKIFIYIQQQDKYYMVTETVLRKNRKDCHCFVSIITKYESHSKTRQVYTQAALALAVDWGPRSQGGDSLLKDNGPWHRMYSLHRCHCKDLCVNIHATRARWASQWYM